MWVMSRSIPWVLGLIFGTMFLVLPAALILGLVVTSLGPIPIFAAIGLLLLSITGTLLEAHSKIMIGTDGVSVRRRLTTHFVPFSEIADVHEVDGVAIRLILHSGAAIDVYTGKDEQISKPKYVRGCERLVEDIRAGIERSQSAGDRSGTTALRDRAHRVLRGEERPERVPYRAAPAPDAESLIRVVENEHGSPASRAAAAVLLNQNGNEHALKRIRVAVDQTANPRLNKLFRVASSDADAETLEQALVEVEQDTTVARSSK